MTAYVALLRGINVLGSGKLPMTDLKAMCEKAGFQSVRTYIASGNVVFKSTKSEARVKAALEDAVRDYSGKSVAVMVRTALEMAAVLAGNPFPEMPGSFTFAFFLNESPSSDALNRVTNLTIEQLQLGQREIYAYYPNGMGQSRLSIYACKNATARNMNTIAKLAAMAAELQRGPVSSERK
jgi:uncharacterized protein (DUF1697 family)